MPDQRWVDLRVGTWNTHASIALRQGGLGWLLDEAPGVAVWCLQEVRDRHHLEDALIREDARRDWTICPVLDEHGRADGLRYDVDGGLPYVLARRRRFRFVEQQAANITFGSKHERRALQVRLEDRRTGRLVVVDDVHVDPLGNGFEAAHPTARRRHEKQVAVHVDQVDEAPVGAVTIAAGDFNESLGADIDGHLHDRTTVARMADVGARPAFQLTRAGDRGVHLDDVFVRHAPFVRVANRRVVTPPQPGNDHRAVIARLQIATAS